MKYLLHIDTSSGIASVAVSHCGNIVASRQNYESRNHAAVLNVLIGEVLDEHKITFKDLDAVVVCAGPGSYTGLRVGMAVAKGICYAMDIPLWLHNRLTLLAYQLFCRGGNDFPGVISLLFAREKECFIAVYDEHFNCKTQPAHLAEEEMLMVIKANQNKILITDIDHGTFNLKGINNPIFENETIIDLTAWAKFVYSMPDCNMNVKLSIAEPFYLKGVYTHK